MSVRDLLFPVGPRQAAELVRLAPHRPPEQTFAAVHAGIARALGDFADSIGAPGPVRRWLRLDDQPAAAAMLWEPTTDVDVSGRVRDAFSKHLAEAGSLGQAYAGTMTPDLRHRLGEHYTPDWLVRRIASQLTGAGPATGADRIADPACGDGRFLVAMLDAGHAPELLAGSDVNPLAVMMARINVWDRLGRRCEVPPTDIRCRDFILDESDDGPKAGPPVDVYLGNPPWVTWRNLSDAYRAAVAERMAGTRLNQNRGWSARVAAGQTDLCHVFIHEAVERLAPGGRITFVLPRTVFKAPVGPGPIRAGVATSGRPYSFVEVWDGAEADPFTGVRVDTAVAFMVADRGPTYPVRWRTIHQYGDGGETTATPSDPSDPGSPWLIGAVPVRLATGARWDLRARGGVNTGGGNSVFHVEIVGTAGANLIIRNVLSRREGHRQPEDRGQFDGRSQPVEVVTAEVEPTFVRPLLRGRDVRAWSAVPTGSIIVPHMADDLRKPVAESTLATQAPLTYAYLNRFRSLLASRKELARWPAEAWYQLFRIGRYTAGCWRVVWPTSANSQLRAAVVADDDPVVPDQKVILVPFDDRPPALFLAALLNSAPVRTAAASSAGLDASPNLVSRLVLPAYSGAAHADVVRLAEAGPAAQGELDQLIAKLFL